jgi:hypothetical protein
MTDADEFDEDDRIVAEKIAYTRATYGKLIARTREIITRHATRMDKLTEVWSNCAPTTPSLWRPSLSLSVSVTPE